MESGHRKTGSGLSGKHDGKELQHENGGAAGGGGGGEVRLRQKRVRGPAANTLIPPFRLAIVEEGIYRAAYPQSRNLDFLKRLGLRTLISLLPSPPSEDLQQFCKEQKIRHMYFEVERPKDEVTVEESLVVQLLEVFIQPDNLPLLLHCLDGSNVTGEVVMCLRKLQNWNLSVTTTEFTRFTRGHSIMSVESEFVENFRAEIKIPLQIPSWLWQGNSNLRHPTLRLKLERAPEVEDPEKGKGGSKGSSRKSKRKDPDDASNQLLDGHKDTMRVSKDLDALDLHQLSSVLRISD